MLGNVTHWQAGNQDLGLTDLQIGLAEVITRLGACCGHTWFAAFACFDGFGILCLELCSWRQLLACVCSCLGALLRQDAEVLEQMLNVLYCLV